MAGNGIQARASGHVLAVAAGIALALCVVLLTFQVLLTPAPTRAFAESFVNDAASPASHAELVETACATLAYCVGDPSAELPLGTDDATSYTPDVMGHLDDVKGFFSGMTVAAVVAAVVLAAAIVALVLLCRRSGGTAALKKPLSRILVIAPVALLAILAGLAIFAVVDFNRLFNMLHALFFSSGSWLFPYDSLLICSLPEEFWMAMGVLWLVLIVVVCAVLLVCGIVIARRSRAAARRAAQA